MAASVTVNWGKDCEILEVLPKERNEEGQIPNKALYPFIEDCIETLQKNDTKASIPLRKAITLLLESSLATKKVKCMLYLLLKDPATVIEERATTCKINGQNGGEPLTLEVSVEQLAAESPYFEMMMRNTEELTLNSPNPEMTRVLLDLLHRFSLKHTLAALEKKTLSFADFSDLIEEARHLMVLNLLRPLLEKPLVKLISGENVTEMAALVAEYQLNEVGKALIKFLVLNGDATIGKELFRALEHWPNRSGFKRLEETVLSLICLQPMSRQEKGEWLPKLEAAFKNINQFTFLPGTKLSEKRVEWILAHLPENLEKLSISGASIKSFAFAKLVRFKELKTLEIFDFKDLVKLELPVFNQLRRIKLKRCPKLSNLEALAGQPKLRHIFFTALESLDLESLRPFAASPNRTEHIFVGSRNDSHVKGVIKKYHREVLRYSTRVKTHY